MTITISHDGRGYVLDTTMRLPGRREDVFPFFADAANLERLTPPVVRFEIVTPPPIEMRAGALIDYRLRIHRVPIRWRTEITRWDPPHGFVDEQRRGPYRWWRHEHQFEDDGDTTLMRDRVEYGVPGGRLVHRLVVGRDVRKIFEYRRNRLQEWFGPAPGGR